MNRDGARGVIGDDPPAQITSTLRAGPRSNDPCVERRKVTARPERALQRRSEVTRLYKRTVVVMNPGTQTKRIGLAAVGHRRQLRSEVRHDLRAGGSGRPPIRDQPIVGGRDDTPPERAVRGAWIERVDLVVASDDAQGSTDVLSRGALSAHPGVILGHRHGLRSVADLDGLDDAVLLRVDT